MYPAQQEAVDGIGGGLGRLPILSLFLFQQPDPAVLDGLRVGEATAVMPFDYTRLIFAGAAGYFFFFEVPDVYTIVGALMIVVATLYIAQREAKEGRGTD